MKQNTDEANNPFGKLIRTKEIDENNKEKQ